MKTKKQVKKKPFYLILVAIFTFLLLVAYVINYAANSEAGFKKGKAYYWCASYKYGQVINRYCYGDSGSCQTYNLYSKRPKNNEKKGLTYSCYSDKVYVKRKGSPCPPADYVIENSSGQSIGCFGGFKETNLKIIKK